jgi:hypothetical protein
VKNLGGVIVFSLLYGFLRDIYIALPPVCFVHLTKDISKIGARIRMGVATCGLGVLVSGPEGGGMVLLERTQGTFSGLFCGYSAAAV